MCPLFALQVFNLNAPVPPNETEALSQATQFQNSYNQTFSSQPQHPVEQAEIQSEQLQSGTRTHVVTSDVGLESVGRVHSCSNSSGSH